MQKGASPHENNWFGQLRLWEVIEIASACDWVENGGRSLRENFERTVTGVHPVHGGVLLTHLFNFTPESRFLSEADDHALGKVIRVSGRRQ